MLFQFPRYILPRHHWCLMKISAIQMNYQQSLDKDTCLSSRQSPSSRGNRYPVQLQTLIQRIFRAGSRYLRLLLQGLPNLELFNPDTDPIPMRRTTDPEPISESTGTQQGSRPPPPPSSTNHPDERGNTTRRLFDHRKDDLFRNGQTPAISTWSTGVSHSKIFQRFVYRLRQCRLHFFI